jgi:hypothetical protein
MSKAFDLSCKKGYYPHFFNTDQHLNYVGPVPQPRSYGVDFMSKEERSLFLEWHETVKFNIFDNKQELVSYCIDDVNVLRMACCSIGSLFLKLVKMDPFRQAITISSICNRVFRKIFLKADTVGIIPRAGYRLGDKQSIEGLKWLAFIGRDNEIVHAGNGREVHLAGVPNLKVDGYCA